MNEPTRVAIARVTQGQADVIAGDPQKAPCTCGHILAGHRLKRTRRGFSVKKPCLRCKCPTFEPAKLEVVSDVDAADRVFVKVLDGYVLRKDLEREEAPIADDEERDITTAEAMRGPTIDGSAHSRDGKRPPKKAAPDLAGMRRHHDQEVSEEGEDRAAVPMNVGLDPVAKAFYKAQPGLAREVLERNAFDHLQAPAEGATISESRADA